MAVLPTPAENSMPLDQLCHDHGVAQVRARHAGTAGLRAEHAVEALRVAHQIPTKRGNLPPPVVPIADWFEVFRADEVQVTSTQFAG